jgi:hypothetical protein
MPADVVEKKYPLSNSPRVVVERRALNAFQSVLLNAPVCADAAVAITR